MILNDAELAFYRSTKMRTYTGRYVDPFAITADDVVLEDIGHGLSNLSRFSGQCSEFYPVALHSVLVAEEACVQGGPLAGMFGLFHDGHEAYGGDMISPIKRRPELAGFRSMQAYVQNVIEKVFGLDAVGEDVRSLVETIDRTIVLDEGKVFFAGPDTAGVRRHYPHLPIEGTTPRLAEIEFLQCFYRMTSLLEVAR